MSAALPHASVSQLVRNPGLWYAAALAIADYIEHTISTEHLYRLMDWSSTNLVNLKPSGHPAEAMVASAFIPQESAGLWPFFALSVLTVVAVLGARRAVLVLGTVHVGVSAVTEALVWWRIHHGSLPGSEAHMWDTGPSYLVVTAMTIAIGCARWMWLRVLWAVTLIGTAPSLLKDIGSADYTAIGHVLSFLAGAVVVAVVAARRRLHREGERDAEPAVIGPAGLQGATE